MQRRVLIIGASSTLGLATARLLSSQLWLTYRSAAKERTILEACPQARLTQLDVTDLKGIAATLAKLSNDKVNEVKDAAKSEARHLQRQGQNVLEDVQDQAGEFEQQLKDKIR